MNLVNVCLRGHGKRRSPQQLCNRSEKNQKIIIEYYMEPISPLINMVLYLKFKHNLSCD